MFPPLIEMGEFWVEKKVVDGMFTTMTGRGEVGDSHHYHSRPTSWACRICPEIEWVLANSIQEGDWSMLSHEPDLIWCQVPSIDMMGRLRATIRAYTLAKMEDTETMLERRHRGNAELQMNYSTLHTPTDTAASGELHTPFYLHPV